MCGSQGWFGAGAAELPDGPEAAAHTGKFGAEQDEAERDDQESGPRQDDHGRADKEDTATDARDNRFAKGGIARPGKTPGKLPDAAVNKTGAGHQDPLLPARWSKPVTMNMEISSRIRMASTNTTFGMEA